MGVLKNDVGRPSNKTIMIRTILKGVCLIIVLGAAVAGGYYLNDYQKKDSDKKPAKKIITTTVASSTKFDANQIVTKAIPDTEDGIYIYVYGKKLDIDAPITKVTKKEVIDDIAIIHINGIDLSALVIVNTRGEIVYSTINDNGDVFINDGTKGIFNVDDNKITYSVKYVMDLSDLECKEEEAIADYEITYKNGVLSKPKKIRSLTEADLCAQD